jgi:hypothetical protein
MIGADETKKTAIAMQEPDLGEIAVVRLGVNVPTLAHVLEHDVRNRGGLPFHGRIIDAKHRNNAIPAPPELRKMLPLVVLLNLPIGINPVRITH